MCGKNGSANVQGPKQGCMPLPGPLKETPKSSTGPFEKTKQEDLTLFDWLTLSLNQSIREGSQILCHKARGRVIVHQPTLSTLGSAACQICHGPVRTPCATLSVCIVKISTELNCVGGQRCDLCMIRYALYAFQLYICIAFER